MSEKETVAAAQTEWRCGGCSTMLGKILPSGEIDIQYKGVSYRVRGHVAAKCRRCARVSTRGQ